MELHAPALTTADCEGGSETFKIGSGKDYFGNDIYLTVSAQMHAEAAVYAHPRIFTFGPVFRAEPHATNRHLCEFPMLELEVAFLKSLESLVGLAEDLLKETLAGVLSDRTAAPYLDHCWNRFQADRRRIESLLTAQFKVIEYQHISEMIDRGTVAFERPFRRDEGLSTEIERWLCEKVVGGPVFVVNYPKSAKPFYMKRNADGESVANFDLLLPGQLEVAGGSLREDDFELLTERVKELGLANLDWYLDLRKFGGIPHGGFGFGFDRILQTITGCPNIRDVCTFPRIRGERSNL